MLRSIVAFLLLSLSAFGEYRVILDADLDSDVDDVQALGMVHTLADQKKVSFLGVIVTSDDPFAPLCTSALNQYFGRPELPVGFLKGQGKLKNHSRYTKQIATEFPRQLQSVEHAEDSTELYRKLLSASPDGTVVIITIGHLSSLQRLMQSGADKHSPLSGEELISRKVAKWLCMGGHFPTGPKEANFYRPDPASTVYTVSRFPKPVVFAGWEVGNKIQTGGEYLKQKLTPKSPVYRAYELYNNFKGRASWDQVAVFMLLPEADRYFSTVKEGYCHVAEDGSNEWRTDQNKAHEYVVFKPGANYDEIARMMDDMVIR